MIATSEFLARVHGLPTLPGAVARLATLLADERSVVADFEAIVRPDPALTANLLRLANSAYFGCRREVGSVRQAIALMGVKRVFEVAASASFARVIPPVVPGYGIEALAFWTHSLAVAVLSERLALEFRREAPPLVFTAGLLHDIGKLAVGSFLLEEQAQLRDRLDAGPLSLVAAEQLVLGTDHAEIGLAVAERWELPPAIGRAARWHHLPAEAPADEEPLLVDLVHVADGLAHALGFGADVGELRREMDRRVTERLGIRASRLEHVASETMEQIREMARLLATPAPRTA